MASTWVTKIRMRPITQSLAKFRFCLSNLIADQMTRSHPIKDQMSKFRKFKKITALLKLIKLKIFKNRYHRTKKQCRI